MFARGQAGRWAARAIGATGALVAATVILAASATVTPASADSVRGLRAEAAVAAARLQQLDIISEQKIQQYDLVNSRYQHTLAELRQNRQLLQSASANLKSARARLALSLEQSYKTGSQDPLAYLLAARSISSLVDQVQLMQRENSDNTSLMQQVAQYRAEVTRSRQALERERRAIHSQLAAADAAKQAALASASSARSYLAGLNAKIRSTIEEQQAAAERAAATAAATAAQQSSGGGGGGTGPVVPGNGSLGEQAVAIAEQYIGVPYVYGGASPSGFDCSGLTMYVYAQLGVSLPHNAAAQYESLPHISESQLEPGDLVFFFGLGHVAMYVGGGTIIQAPHTGSDVSYASLASMQSGYVGAARVP
jgi:cell wall-associated NlpC family hydrolase